MITHGTSIKIFTGNSNPQLARDIAEHVGIPMGHSEVSRFSDGEISVNIYETVRGADVFVVQSTCYPVNDNLMEMLIMIDAFKRASAGRITAVIPYYGYARQDRKAKARDPITAKAHCRPYHYCRGRQGFDHGPALRRYRAFSPYPWIISWVLPYWPSTIWKGFEHEDLIVVSPDIGSVTRARNFANRLNAPIAIVDKRRPKANVAEVMNIIGDIKGKKVLLVDDMMDTAGTLVQSAMALLEGGAKEIYACATHGVLSGPAIERVQNSPIKELVITDTIPLPPEKQIDKIKVLSVAPIFAEAIDRIYEDLPVSTLFE